MILSDKVRRCPVHIIAQQSVMACSNQLELALILIGCQCPNHCHLCSQGDHMSWHMQSMLKAARWQGSPAYLQAGSKKSWVQVHQVIM